ncbi:MAG: Lrp/AsnC ligand binding domain-containing protein, partial [Anaerolineales bacterium]|nr:Lrp/AsnC ligand binding domain-containing protein [Anaerolineales bacterium]
ILKAKVKDMNDLDEFIVQKLRAMPSIFLTATMIIAKEHK